MELNGFKSTAESLVKLGSVFEFANAKLCDDCLRITEVREIANSNQKLLFHDQHVRECVRCQSWLSLFRGDHAINVMPSSWSICVESEQKVVDPTFSQTLGFIELNSLEFHSCDQDLFGKPSPSCMRLNLVVDAELQSISLTLLDVPSAIKRIFVTAFGQPMLLDTSDLRETFEFCIFDDGEFETHSDESHASFFGRVFGNELLLEFETCEIRPERFSSMPLRQLLEEFKGFQEEFEYVLPSGHLSEVHFNLAELCKHDEVLVRLATELEKRLPDDLDVVVSSSWAMAMIARRIIRLRNLRNRAPLTREVLCEGYTNPVLTDSICDGERVAVISDVAVTGTQLKRVSQLIRKKGGRVVATASLIVAEGAEFDFELESLLTADLGLHDGTVRFQGKTRMHFNPLANDMTVKKDSRAPSQFLQENQEAAEFWHFLNEVIVETKGSGIQYYKRHHVEGNTHYTQFLDTGRLLQHPMFGSYLIERIRDQLAESSIVPEVFVVPDRPRATLFANMLACAFELAHTEPVQIVVVSRGRDGFWRFTEQARETIAGKFAMIIDTAVGSGKTVDLFGIAASEYSASSVGVCTLLSRLPESAEIAFAERFDAGFHRIFNLPTRPIVVRGSSTNDCPYCHRKEILKNAAELSGSEAIKRLSALRRRFVPIEGATVEAPPKQMLMFEQTVNDDIFRTCTPTIAGGITLHSLYAAQNNGMATLVLPEIRNDKIPSRNREAMVQDLPIGAVQWSRGDLDNDLLKSMEEVELPSLWGASAVALANERYSEWFFELDAVVERSSRLRNSENSMFWQRLSYSAYITACNLPESDVHGMTKFVRALIEEYADTNAEQGLRKVLDSIVYQQVEPEDSLVELY